ncbi:MAG: hypothetical protein ABSF96_05945 [Steroidobacteraceae bacterium]|jgi:hypothetical protein
MPDSKYAKSISAVACACLSSLAFSQEAWFLLPHEGSHYSLVAMTADAAVQSIAELGFVVSYGDSQDAMAFLSQDGNGATMLDVISKSSKQTTLSLPIAKDAIPKHSGVERSIALTDTFASFAVFHAPPTRPPFLKNELGGAFDFIQVSLRAGEVTSLPLPADCGSPTVVDFNGTPLVFAYNSYGVWKFDSSTKSLQRLVSKEDLADVLTEECRAFDCGEMQPQAFAEYVGVPGAGVFRVSQLGTLDEVLDANLAPVHQPRPTLKLGLRGPGVGLFPGTFDGSPAIAIFQVKEDSRTWTLTYVDARSLSVKWETTLPQRKGPGLPRVQAWANGVIYVNSEAKTVEDISPTGMHTLWSLNPMAPLVAPADGPYALTGAFMVWMTAR